MAAAKGRFEDEGWRVRKDGSRFWANVDHHRDARRPGAAPGLLQGHARRHRAPARPRRRSKAFAGRLERSNRELQEFASVASHDLQEPLRKIQAFGDRLQAKCAAALGERGPRLPRPDARPPPGGCGP